MAVEIKGLPEKESCYYFGSHGFCIIAKNNIEEEQLGYRVDPSGKDLTGNNDGDWLPSWYTIGRDTDVGDPFFIDASTEKMPVYTAMHGQGEWSPDLVSNSLQAFISSLEYLRQKSGQTEDLVEPDDSTIIDNDELEDIQSHIVSLCGEEAEEFWEMLIEQHQDWILESED